MSFEAPGCFQWEDKCENPWFRPLFIPGGDIAGASGNAGDILGCHIGGGAADIWWVEASAAA